MTCWTNTSKSAFKSSDERVARGIPYKELRQVEEKAEYFTGQVSRSTARQE